MSETQYSMHLKGADFGNFFRYGALERILERGDRLIQQIPVGEWECILVFEKAPKPSRIQAILKHIKRRAHAAQGDPARRSIFPHETGSAPFE